MTTKRASVRIQVDDPPPNNHNNDHGNEGKEEEDKKKQDENFYTRVYDDAVTKRTPIDNTIIEQTCEVGGGRVESLARVMGGAGDGAASHHAAYATSLRAIHHQRQQAHQRYSNLVHTILTHEPDLQAQEERKREGEKLLERERKEYKAREEEVERLQQLIHTTRKTTAATTAKVATYSTYREYVERSVATFGSEASTVEGVCGRFRDLLTLRLQLFLKVNLALHQLHQARKRLLVFVQSEKEREGQALLQLYRERAAGWTSSRNLGEMEARLAALQTASTHTHTHLTRVRLALVNIYSVARAYQRSLPPLGPKAATSSVLKRLHNFLLDAMTVTTTARTATQPASLRPSASSITKPVGREAVTTRPVHDAAKKEAPDSDGQPKEQEAIRKSATKSRRPQSRGASKRAVQSERKVEKEPRPKSGMVTDTRTQRTSRS